MSPQIINVKVFARRFSEMLDASNENTHTIAAKLSLTPGTISRYSNGKMAPKITTAYMLADIFHVSPEWLMGYDVEKYTDGLQPSMLSARDNRDIARTLEGFMTSLEDGGDLMFDGNPMSDEAKESIRSAVRLGLEAAKATNKKRFTPKKYREEG